jgi:hypothetical protein
MEMLTGMTILVLSWHLILQKKKNLSLIANLIFVILNLAQLVTDQKRGFRHLGRAFLSILCLACSASKLAK